MIFNTGNATHLKPKLSEKPRKKANPKYEEPFNEECMVPQILNNYIPTWAQSKLPAMPSSNSKNKQTSNKKWANKPNKPIKVQYNSKFIQQTYPNGEIGPDYDLIMHMENEIVEKTPNITFDDIAELHDAKQALKEAILLPILVPDFYKGIRRPWKGVMLFGPPGTGKTLLAKAVANMGKSTFFNVSAASLASKWRGESEKMVRILFQMARFYAPSTIFFDEMDALFSKSTDENESTGRVKAELLVQMDGVQEISSTSSSNQNPNEKRVMVLAATNRPWSLEDALIRRLEKRIYIPLPTETGRKQIFQINLKTLNVTNVDYDYLAKKTDFYSGADITVLCREAAMMPMREHLKKVEIDKIAEIKNINDEPITVEFFKKALSNIKPSVNKSTLDRYKKWMSEFGCI